MQAEVINFAEARAQLQVAEVMRETRDAYSRPAYGETEWAKCAAVLLGLGHSVEATVTLLVSRLTRWAREDAVNYDAPTSDDLVRFLNTPAGASTVERELAA